MSDYNRLLSSQDASVNADRPVSIDMNPHGEGMTDECRICLESHPREDLISPCLCRGTSQFVHRHCLDTWRALNNNQAFTHCGTCGFEYHLELLNPHVEDSEEQNHRCRTCQYHAFVARDTFAVFVMIQMCIAVLGTMIRLCDPQEALVHLFNFPQQKGQLKPHGFINALKHHKTTYYFAGLILFIFLLGLFHSCVLKALGYDELNVCEECGCQGVPNCNGPCYVGDCGGGGGGGGGCQALAAFVIAIAVIIVMVIFILGLMTGFVLASILVQRIVQRHSYLKVRKRLTREFRVKDMAEELHSNRDPEVQPSAPPLPFGDQEEGRRIARRLTIELDRLGGRYSGY